MIDGGGGGKVECVVEFVHVYLSATLDNPPVIAQLIELLGGSVEGLYVCVEVGKACTDGKEDGGKFFFYVDD